MDIILSYLSCNNYLTHYIDLTNSILKVMHIDKIYIFNKESDDSINNFKSTFKDINVESIKLGSTSNYNDRFPLVHWKLLMRDYIKESRFLYLDGDIACLNKFDELFDETKYQDPVYMSLDYPTNEEIVYYLNLNGINPDEYYNTGVILFNNFQTPKFDTPYIYTNKFPEQDFWNKNLGGITKLSLKYNYFPRPYSQNLKYRAKYDFTELRKCIEYPTDNVVFMHWRSANKPWDQDYNGPDIAYHKDLYRNLIS